MTVGPSPKDSDGASLNTKVTNLTATAATAAGKANAASASAALDQAQRELVYHYLNIGRLTAANILSTMT